MFNNYVFVGGNNEFRSFVNFAIRLLYCNASHVDTVFAAGKVKKANGIVLGADIETLRARSQQAAERLWKKAA